MSDEDQSGHPGGQPEGVESLQRRAAVGDLAAGIVHETRNLVTAIRGFAQVALGSLEDQAELDRLLRTIDTQSARAAEALSTFLGFARGEVEGRRIIDVNELVSDAARLVRQRLKLDRVRLELDLAERAPALRGDPGELQQVLVNLAFNARDAMEGGGTLWIRTAAEGGDAVIEVADSGPGVAEEVRARIFEPYVSTKPSGQGTGLGLSIVSRIVAGHGGTIDVREGDRGGAVFSVRIPLEEAGDG